MIRSKNGDLVWSGSANQEDMYEAASNLANRAVEITPILLIISDSSILRDAVQDPASSHWNPRFNARLFKRLIGEINARNC